MSKPSRASIGVLSAGEKPAGGSKRSLQSARALLSSLLAAHERQRASIASVLDPVAAYDRRKNTHYLRTLDVFVRVSFSTHATAKALGVHRHTVDYRIRRIESLLGRSVRTGLDRLLVEMALFARSQMLKGIEEPLQEI
jgi:DNA-binding PucR family transcriptional regulator